MYFVEKIGSKIITFYQNYGKENHLQLVSCIRVRACKIEVLNAILTCFLRYREATEILKAIIDGCRVSMPLALEIVIRRAGLEIMYNNSDIADLPIQEFFDILGGINTSINQQQVICILHQMIAL